MTDKEEQHEKFKQRLANSTTAVWAVAKWLSGRGHDVQVPSLFAAPKYEDRSEYTDRGDILMCSPIDVKHLSVDFTCREDWEYGDNFIVDGKTTFDKKLQPPLFYVIVNRSMTHAAIVRTSTKKHWKVQSRHDKVVGFDCDFYFCPIELVEWHTL